MDYQVVEKQILEFIKESVVSANAKGAVIGLSGGIDSSLVAALAVKALGNKNVLGLIMPCESSGKDMEDALLLVEKLGIKHKVIDLTSTYKEFLKDNEMEEKSNLSFANIKPRLRMTTLYFHGSLNGYLVLGTSNKSELITGYLTKYGDGGVDIEPIGDLLKREVYQMAINLDLPERLITKAPSAGLLPGQTDEKELGFTYGELDEFINSGKGDPTVIEKIMRLYNLSRHKLEGPKILDLNRDFYLK